MGILQSAVNKVLGLDTAPADWMLGVDVSHWQGDVWWEQMWRKGVQFAILKMTDFYKAEPRGFVDDKYIQNWHGTREQGIKNGGYHWLQPKVDPYIQSDFYLDTYFKYQTDLPPVLDFEDRDWISPNDMLWRAQVWLNKVESETGRIPIVYTSAGFMSSFAKDKASFLSRYPLWIANYIQRTYPTMPVVWTDWKIWQYSDKGDYPWYVWKGKAKGREYGVESDGLDMNWFKGNYTDLLNFCQYDIEDMGNGYGEVTQPGEEPVPLPESLDAKVIVAVLNVRALPTVQSPKVGVRVRGDVITAKDIVIEDPRRIWVRDELGWSALVYDGVQMVE